MSIRSPYTSSNKTLSANRVVEWCHKFGVVDREKKIGVFHQKISMAWYGRGESTCRQLQDMSAAAARGCSPKCMLVHSLILKVFQFQMIWVACGQACKTTVKS